MSMEEKDCKKKKKRLMSLVKCPRRFVHYWQNVKIHIKTLLYFVY